MTGEEPLPHRAARIGRAARRLSKKLNLAGSGERSESKAKKRTGPTRTPRTRGIGLFATTLQSNLYRLPEVARIGRAVRRLSNKLNLADKPPLQQDGAESRANTVLL
jgi:hypothetical protein